MRTFASLAAVLLGLAVLSGCASSGTARSTAPSPDTRVTDDDRYMAAVERTARQRGIVVVWVNKPSTRPATTTAAAE